MKLKRMLSAALAALLLAGCATAFAGCSRTRMPEKETVDHVYRCTTISLPEEVEWIRDSYVQGDRIIILAGDVYDSDTGETMRRTYSVNLDGTDMRLVEEERITYDYTSDEPQFEEQQRLPADDGSMWKVYYSYRWIEATGESESKYILRHMAADGTQLCEVDCDTLWLDGVDEYGNEFYHYVSSAEIVGENLLFMDSGALYALGSDGTLLWAVPLNEILQNAYISSMFAYGDTLCLLRCDYSSSQAMYSLVYVDMATGQIGATTEIESDIFDSMWNVVPGEGYTFYCTDENGVYGYDMETGTVTELMNYMNSDVSSDMVNDLCVISRDMFVCNGWDDMSGDSVISVFTRVPDEEVTAKWILYMAVVGNSYSVRSQVMAFNRRSEEYRIRITEYAPGDYYTEGEEYDYEELIGKAVNALNNDIIAGNMPDLLYVNSYVPVENYISKGLLEDLYPYIDADEELQRDDFLANILGAMEVDGKLYQIMPSFSVRTLIGKTENLGGRTGWTVSEFMNWVQTIPEESSVFWDTNRDTLLELFCTTLYEEFVDPATGECHFDSEEFRQILTFLSTIPETSRSEMQDMYDEEYWNEYENRYRENKAMLEMEQLRNFRQYSTLMNYEFYNEDLTLIGMPTADGNGASIEPYSLSFAVSAKSVMKDAAWDFIRYFLTEEYQDTITYPFPIRKDALQNMADEAVRDAEEERKEYEDYMESLDDDIVFESNEKQYFLTRENADQIVQMLSNANRVYRINTSVLDIIRSDAAAFFAGQKSLDETVKIIQDRVSTYVAENR